MICMRSSAIHTDYLALEGYPAVRGVKKDREIAHALGLWRLGCLLLFQKSSRTSTASVQEVKPRLLEPIERAERRVSGRRLPGIRDCVDSRVHSASDNRRNYWRESQSPFASVCGEQHPEEHFSRATQSFGSTKLSRSK
jgi:hypothetical protein